MSENQQENVEFIEETTVRSGAPGWLVAVVVVLVLGVGYLVYAQQQAYSELTAGLEALSAQQEARAVALEENILSVKAELEETAKQLGITKTQLSRARALAQQNREEQRKSAAELAARIEQSQEVVETKLGSITTEVAGVRGDVQQNRQTIEETLSQLQRTMGDLGIQSGLIASNKDELEALRKRGARNYFEFDLRKSKKYTRVGEISLRLNKSDQKRQKFTLTVLANDKRIEKKDKTLLEPVQFYQRGTRNLLEIVVFEVTKNRVAGYLSAPKETATRSASN